MQNWTKQRYSLFLIGLIVISIILLHLNDWIVQTTNISSSKATLIPTTTTSTTTETKIITTNETNEISSPDSNNNSYDSNDHVDQDTDSVKVNEIRASTNSATSTKTDTNTNTNNYALNDQMDTDQISSSFVSTFQNKTKNTTMISDSTIIDDSVFTIKYDDTNDPKQSSSPLPPFLNSQQVHQVDGEVLPLPYTSTTTNNTTTTNVITTTTTKSSSSLLLPISYGTILVQLSGELANNLHHIAHGIGLQQWAMEEQNIHTNIVLRHFMGANNRAPKPKWKKARKDIQNCFPNLATLDFELGNSNEYKIQSKRQKEWLMNHNNNNNNNWNKNDQLLDLLNSRNISDIQRGMELFKELSMDPNRPQNENENNNNNNNNNIRIPFVISSTLDVFPMIDRYYSKIRSMFEFQDDNNTKCCLQLPTKTDTVFHFRNYISEMPDWRAYDMGFLELSPKRAAQDLFGHLLVLQSSTTTLSSSSLEQQQQQQQLSSTRQNDMDDGVNNNNIITDSLPSLRITTRIPNQKARNYIQALHERQEEMIKIMMQSNGTTVIQNNGSINNNYVSNNNNNNYSNSSSSSTSINMLLMTTPINASLVEDQTGIQDFCFLKHTQKELIGSARSTFVLWASLLGNATITRLYHVNNTGLRNRHSDFWERFTYNWTNPELQRRIRFELYESEDMDGF